MVSIESRAGVQRAAMPATDSTRAGHGLGERGGGLGGDQRPGVVRARQPDPRGQWRGVRTEPHVGDAPEGQRLTGEDAAGVEARRQVERPLQRHASVGRADAVQAAGARWCADRAAGVGTEREVAQSVAHGRCRAARGATGDPVGCAPVVRCQRRAPAPPGTGQRPELGRGREACRVGWPGVRRRGQWRRCAGSARHGRPRG
jgi:hypothetical protein